jgi:hypothetical protein
MDEMLVDVAVVDDDAFIALRSAFVGELLRSADDGYDAARRANVPADVIVEVSQAFGRALVSA